MRTIRAQIGFIFLAMWCVGCSAHHYPEPTVVLSDQQLERLFEFAAVAESSGSPTRTVEDREGVRYLTSTQRFRLELLEPSEQPIAAGFLVMDVKCTGSCGTEEGCLVGEEGAGCFVDNVVDPPSCTAIICPGGCTATCTKESTATTVLVEEIDNRTDAIDAIH